MTRSVRSVRPWLALLVALCLAPVARAGEPRALRVFAAASLADVIDALAEGFPGPRIVTSLGGSGLLAHQIRDGAPADVFLSASPAWTDFLREAHGLAGPGVAFAGNRLVCITAPGSGLDRSRPRDARALLDALPPGARIGVADEGVPAGEYARAALRRLGLLDAALPRLVGQKDVRAVLVAVERGELDAGFVYATDAHAGSVEVLFAFDPAAHPPIEYVGAVVRETSQPDEARRFLEHLRAPAARAILTRAGFTPL